MRDRHGVVEDADPVLDGALVVLQTAQEHEDEGDEERELDEAAEVGQGVPGQVHVHASDGEGRLLHEKCKVVVAGFRCTLKKVCV